MGPFTSYWPATISPGLSVALKLYGWPQLGQKPSSRLTRLSQCGQMRRAPGTSGLARISLIGSVLGIGGSETSPPPSRERVVTEPRVARVARRLPVLRVPAPVAAVPTVPVPVLSVMRL